MKTLTEDQIIANHEPSVRARARIELRIVNCIIETAKQRQCVLRVAEYEEDESGPYDVRSALFDLDDATLEIYGEDGAYIGWARLVFGNDGYDLISDYSLAAEDFLGDALAESATCR